MNENQLYQITSVTDDPYSSVIGEFLMREFPAAARPNQQSLLEILTTIFVSTSQTRYGPAPKPESLVAIREVLRHYIGENRPIPVLVPWGGRKAMPEFSLDVAEVMALKQLECLHRVVSEQYRPGVQFNIRIEDTGAEYLYQDDGHRGELAVEGYSSDFQKLVRVLNLYYINPIRESSLMNSDEYFGLADQIYDAMVEYLIESDLAGFDINKSKAWVRLKNFGWQGEIPPVQRDFYRSRYRAHDPGISQFDATQKLAQYFSGSLARYKLDGSARDKDWGNKYLQVSFVPPIPGAPEALTGRNLYYRTVPERMSRSHMPAWRSRGYFKVGPTGVTPKLAGFHENLDLIPHNTVLSRAGESVQIVTDYVVKD